MSLFNVFGISTAGMDVQQTRLEIAASNLANSHTSKTAKGAVYQPLAAVIRSETSHLNGSTSLPRPVVADIVPTNAAPKLVYDPGHPHADERGFVSLPGVDPLSSMLDLMSISRAYEANLRAFDITRSLIQRTIEIGNRR